MVWLWRFAAGDVAPLRVTGCFEWRPDDAIAPLVLDTAELFRPL